MTPFSVNKLPSSETPKFPNNIPINPFSCIFSSFFTVSLTPAINIPKFYDFVILIITFISFIRND